MDAQLRREREEMRKIIMIKVILGILGVVHSMQKKNQETETHLLSDDEVDELAVLLGINLYSAEDHRIFISEMTRTMVDNVLVLI